MKNVKLGLKIALGFGILIVLAAALGGGSIWSMKGVEVESTMLANEYVPEVDVAVELRGAANRIMYEMRGYGFTEDQKYYDNALTEFQAAEKALAKARELEKNSPNLKKLKGQIEIATKAVEGYKELAKQTQDMNMKLAEDRKILDASAAKYMVNSNDFLVGQNKKFKVDLAERQKKIALVTELVNVGSNTRVLNFKSQALRDSQLMQDAIEKIGKAEGFVVELRSVTRDAADIKRIDDTQAAAKGYQNAMKDFLVEYKKGSNANKGVLDKYRKLMDTNAAQYVRNCDDFLTGQQEKLTTDMTERNDKITIVNDIIDIGNATRIAAFKSQAMREPKVIEDAVKNFEKTDGMFERIRKITRDKVDLDRLDEIQAAGREYVGTMSDFLDNWLVLQDLGTKRGEAGAAVIEACKTTADAGMEATNRIASEAVASLGNSTSVMIVGLIVVALLGITVAAFITRGITKPVNRIVATLTEGSDQVASASGQVSSSSQSLAEGTAEQAASLEETSSSLEEMASMTKQNADNAGQADNLMKEANQVVVKANDSMTELTTSMEEISKASEETSKIIKTIDEIAFQTNLLALNAAVEAARAGEAGAGFAVVADEVRNLAMRAADAAKNTADLIEGTVKKVKDGSELVTSTNEAFTEVATSASKVGELVGEIAAASNEQSQGIEQVNKAMGEMDKVVQSAAANAEESASASEEMSAQAEQMKGIVGDLNALVNGSGAASTAQSQALQITAREGHQQHHTVGSKIGAGVRKVLAAPKKAKAGAQGTHQVAAHQQAKEVRPEEVIPMDDADFKDF